MDYQAALDYIFHFTDYEKTPGVLYTSANYDLRRMEELLARLGNPHLQGRTVHIAGTKGKGSTAAMIASVLSTAGYRTGLYTSPHLLTLRERIRVDGALITEEELAALVERLQPEVEAVNQHLTAGQLTTFEVLTALAFVYFQEKSVDFQVLEVGLGGRLDATNVVKPGVSVITSISLDHTEVLGDSLEGIAREKAGIIKQGSVVVSAPQEPEVAVVLKEVCRERNARLVRVGRDVLQGKGLATPEGQSFSLWGRGGRYDLTIPLLGGYQLENAATAVAVLEELAALGVELTVDGIARGLSQVSWPGRFQILRRRPWLVVDGAHNPYSAKKLTEAVAEYFPRRRVILVFGTSSDKDFSGMIKELLPLAPHFIVTRSRHPRSASTSQLITELARQGGEGEEKEGVSQAISRALDIAGKEDLILVTGSLFLVAEAIEFAAMLSPGEKEESQAG